MADVAIARRYPSGGGASYPIDLPSQFSGSGVLMRQGEVMQPVYRTVPRAVEMVRRMAPWCSLILAPRLYVRGYYATKIGQRTSYDPLDLIEYENETWEAAGGVAVPAFNAIYVSMQCGPRGILEVTAHECWHAIEARLAPWMIALIDSQIDAEAACAPWDSEYHRRPEEVRARAFETWCERGLSGLPAPLYVRRPGDPETLDEIFASAWSGELAAELEAERAAEAA